MALSILKALHKQPQPTEDWLSFPIVIFTPGKVGSLSVQASLLRKFEEMGINTPVHHVHILEKIDQRIDFISRVRKDPAPTVIMLLESKELRAEIDRDRSRKWNLITLVRDPLAVKVSALFQLIDEYIPGWRELPVEEVMHKMERNFLEKEEFGTTGLSSLDDWFDRQIQPVFGVDVYALPFDRAKGYSIYSLARTHLLILRLEDLNCVAEHAFSEFLGLKDFSIVRTNISEEKPYIGLYESFKKKPLPGELVDLAYGLRYATHFYTPAEIQSFRAKWKVIPDGKTIAGREKLSLHSVPVSTLPKESQNQMTSTIPSAQETEPAPIIILQPGKVGSLSIKESLEQAFERLGEERRIIHAHALNHLEARASFVKRTRTNPADSLNLIREWQELRREINAHPEKEWKVINLVRDPVAMKVSAVFQVLYQHIPDWESRYQSSSLSIEDINNLFFSKSEFGFSGLERWYDEQIKALWGIDVYATPFPFTRGYAVYQAGNIHLLIIRLEDLDRVARQAFHKFLGLKDFQVVRVNIGDEKSYADLYQAFRSQPFPASYLDHAYSTRFARHFYSPEEIGEFYRRWSGSGGTLEAKFSD